MRGCGFESYGFCDGKIGLEGGSLEDRFVQLNWKCEKNSLIEPMSYKEMDWAFCVIRDDDGYYYIYYVKPYVDDRKIYRMHSSDGKTNWTENSDSAVLWGEKETKYDGGVTCPTVWKENGHYHMIFSGLSSRDGKWRAFYAMSEDGALWSVQNNSNPIITTGDASDDWDYKHAEPTGVIKVEKDYYCWYNNIDCDTATSRQMGLATSTDLLKWSKVKLPKDSNKPIFGDGRFCPSPIKYGDKYYLFVCHFVKDCRHSEIELYCCANPLFYPADRKCLGIVKSYVSGSSWEANVLDPAFVLTDTISRNTFSASDNQLWMYYGADTDEGGTRGIGLCTAELSKLLQQS